MQEAVIKHRLSARQSEDDVGRGVTSQWINTCHVCSAASPNEHCGDFCKGRTEKFSWRSSADCCFDFETVKTAVRAGHCECSGCREFKRRLSHDEITTTYSVAPWCRALRGYRKEMDNPIQRRVSFHDEQMCRSCFSRQFFELPVLQVRIGGSPYRVVFRASAHSWRATTTLRPKPPRHYIHSLEEGLGIEEWTYLHIGRHWACHGPNSPCEMVSTTVLLSEAMRRLDEDRVLQAICVPEFRWSQVACDVSRPSSFSTDMEKLETHCATHKMKPASVWEHALTYREVVLDRRVLRDHPTEFIVLELSRGQCVHIKRMCDRVEDDIHICSANWLRVEWHARRFIKEHLSTSLGAHSNRM